MTDHIVVVGGGIAGLGAAAELGRRGLPVTLVEAGDTLGGHGARWACMATTACQRCGACLVHDALAEVERSPTVTRRTGGKVVAAQRTDVGIRLDLGAGEDAQASGETLTAAGVVLATGFTPFAPDSGRPVGAAGHPAVVTTATLNDALRAHRLDALPFGVGDARRIAFLHCVGSRDPAAGREPCSQICCGVAFKSARRLAHLRPGWALTLFHIDLQIHGKEARTAFAAEHGLRFVQGVPAEIRPGTARHAPSGAPEPSPAPAMELVYQGPDGQVVTEGFDGAVLAVGMRPRPGTSALAQSLGLRIGPWGFLEPGRARDPRVVAAGACQGPMGLEASLLQGRAAAARLVRTLPRPATGHWALGAPPTAGPRGDGDAAASGSVTTAVEPQVVVVGRGTQAAVLVASLRDAKLPVRWIQPALPASHEAPLDAETLPSPAADVRPTEARALGPLEGTLGAFRLVVDTDQGRERIPCGAVALCGDLRRAAPVLGALGALAVDRLEAPNPTEAREATPLRLALWLDPAAPAWRPAAARLLADLADAQAGGHAEVTLIADHVALPGLAAQGHYDRARRAGLRVLRPGGAPLGATREGATLSLELRDALAPEVPVHLRVDALLEAAHPAPVADHARVLGIATDAEGFAPGANVRLAPLRTERPGVYVLGSARGEALPEERATQREGLVAELRDLLGAGQVAWPAPAVAIDDGRCVHCLTCLRSCPHQAITTPPHGAPTVSALGCEACGRCLALCPALAIRWSDGPSLPPRTTLSRGADRRPAPGGAEVPCFACRHSGAPALRQAQAEGRLGDLPLRLEEVPCVSAVGELSVLGALLAGAPRVVLLGCHPGSCNHLDGDAHCALRVARLRQTLADIGQPPGKVIHVALSPAEPDRLALVLREHLAEGGQP